jgi:hypothetical protein
MNKLEGMDKLERNLKAMQNRFTSMMNPIEIEKKLKFFKCPNPKHSEHKFMVTKKGGETTVVFCCDKSMKAARKLLVSK